MKACPLILVLAFFITLDGVELKNASGEWVTVIRPDKRVDLSQEEPAVRFFNNGRIPEGEYVNVRVTFTPGAWQEAGTRLAPRVLKMERGEDYAEPFAIKKGTFVGVSFSFDHPERLNAEAVQEVRVTIDQQTRVDGSDRIKIWS